MGRRRRLHVQRPGAPRFADISERLQPYISPYDPQTWRSPKDAAVQFYSRRPETVVSRASRTSSTGTRRVSVGCGSDAQGEGEARLKNPCLAPSGNTLLLARVRTRLADPGQLRGAGPDIRGRTRCGLWTRSYVERLRAPAGTVHGEREAAFRDGNDR